MSIIEKIADPQVQQEYYEHYMKRADPEKNKTAAFSAFWKSSAMQQLAQTMADGSFQLDIPEKIVLPNGRDCYVYPQDQTFMLAFLAYLLRGLTHNDPICVYSNGEGGVNSFIQNHMKARKTPGSVVVRTDIRKFTKTIKRSVFIEVQRRLLADDPDTLALLERFAARGTYTMNGETFETERNIFMGTALDGYVMNAVFFEADRKMNERCLDYARFYDDIAMVVRNHQEAEEVLEDFQQEAAKLQLELHPKKTFITEGDKPYELLGMVIEGTKVGLSKQTREGYLRPVRQQCRRVMKMVRMGKVPGNVALVQAVQTINQYLDMPRLKKQYNPLLDCITCPDGLRIMDHAMQDWLRAVAAGTTSNAKYRISYETLKAAGYRSVMEMYYQRHAR